MEPVTFKRGNVTILIYPPDTSREDQEKVLEEVKRINLEIWREIHGALSQAAG